MGWWQVFAVLGLISSRTILSVLKHTYVIYPSRTPKVRVFSCLGVTAAKGSGSGAAPLPMYPRLRFMYGVLFLMIQVD